MNHVLRVCVHHGHGFRVYCGLVCVSPAYTFGIRKLHSWGPSRCSFLRFGQASRFLPYSAVTAEGVTKDVSGLSCFKTCIEPSALGRGIVKSTRNFSSSALKLAVVVPTKAKEKKSGVLVALRNYVWEKTKRLFGVGSIKGGTLQQAGFVMYSCCTDPLNYVHFFDVLGLPDTFNSWFKITELHVWMCLLRLGNEGGDGRLVRKQVVKSFWTDVDTRSRELGTFSNRKASIGELGDQFRATMFGYDEGFLRDDKFLTAALWRQFFSKECDDPRKIELMVHYIRKQVENLETQDTYRILTTGIVKWVALSEVN